MADPCADPEAAAAIEVVRHDRAVMSPAWQLIVAGHPLSVVERGLRMVREMSGSALIHRAYQNRN